ncbi:protein rhomboid-like isoform X2 [Sitodiplosis mosellana]|uniref:protein rhomboid-like isoform X2 n=1 Tax=Sitodiplosis mosellana TaxID=263140 RepID=UPI002443E4D1|nr:protein rhomboid-like isoform X2 [Sitodiplosis mosellana]
MSSGSNLSWCTADNEPDESVQFLEGMSEKSLNLRVLYVVPRPQQSNNVIQNIQNDRTVCESVVQVQENTTITGSCCCCRSSMKIIRRITELYALKMPWIIVLLSIVQVIVYFVACNDSIALLIFKPQKKYDLWRFITYHTIHFNLTHLLLNVALQVLNSSIFQTKLFRIFQKFNRLHRKAHSMDTVTILFGFSWQILIALPLETTEGHIRVLFVYFSGVAFGALGSLLLNPTQAIVGSSGGIYSLLFSHISQCILKWTQISHRTFRLAAVLMLFFSDVLFLILKHIYWSNVEPKISYIAHISGGIAGLFTGLIVFKKRNNPSKSL